MHFIFAKSTTIVVDINNSGLETLEGFSVQHIFDCKTGRKQSKNKDERFVIYEVKIEN